MYLRTEKRRSFQPPWYRVAIYQCPACKREYACRISTHGPHPAGAVGCDCGAYILGFDGRDRITTPREAEIIRAD